MPKAKKKPVPEGNESSAVQWAPISTMQRAAMMPQPPPAPAGAPPPSNSSFSSPASEGQPGSGNMLRASDLRVHQPVLPSNGPTGQHHHHYIPTPGSSGRGTPTGVRPGASSGPPISSYGGPASRHSRSPFPGADHPGPSSHVLPSVESPQLSTGRRTPAGDQRPPPPPGIQPFGARYSQPPPPPSLPAHRPPSSLPSPSQDHPLSHPPTGSTEPLQHRSLTEDEIRRTQRFMSLNWRVGVINHPPFARRNNPPDHPPSHPYNDHHPPQGPRPQVAGFVGQSQSFPSQGGQRPR